MSTRDDARSVRNILLGVDAVLNWLATRGITRERALALLATAEAENRDLTTEEVQSEIDTLSGELDETERLISGN